MKKEEMDLRKDACLLSVYCYCWAEEIKRRESQGSCSLKLIFLIFLMIMHYIISSFICIRIMYEKAWLERYAYYLYIPLFSCKKYSPGFSPFSTIIIFLETSFIFLGFISAYISRIILIFLFFFIHKKILLIRK